eukprot:1146716-Pelagomonas_calceolata.AAC.2
MRMRTHLHAELIQTISSLFGHSPHPVHFYKGKAHSSIIGNEGADTCARAAALTDTTDIALPDARDPFHNLYWLSLKFSHERNGKTHHSHSALIHYLTNLTDKLETHMHKRHELGSVDTSGHYHNSWQPAASERPTPPTTKVISEFFEANNLPTQLPNKGISYSFWKNPNITLKHQINVLKHCTVYT